MMSWFDNLALGFSAAASLNNLFYCLIGVSLGTFIGVLPGVGPLVTISILLPLTFNLPPEGALIMLAGIYYGASYGGSTTSILVNLPGESSSVVTCLDGYQMARQGRAGPALMIAAVGSFVAGCIGTLLIALFAPMLSSFALEFGPAEYASLVVLALVATSILVRGAILSGLCMAVLGIILGLVGSDVNSGVMRFTFGHLELMQGIDFAVVAIGLFALTEIVVNLERPVEQVTVADTKLNLIPRWSDLKISALPMLRGTAVGSFIGVLPGVGTTISSFAAYMLEKRVARDPSRFGNGAIEGVASPEAANNAAAQTSFIPTLTLGIPGSPTMALILGALMIHGIAPGPGIMSNEPRLVWALIVSMWIGNVMLVVLNLPLVGLWVKMLKIPYRIFFPAILLFSCVGTYSLSSQSFDVYLIALFCVLGYVLRRLDCEIAPLILGLVLGPLFEENTRRALLISHGDPGVFIATPISATCLTAAAILLAMTVIPAVRRRRNEAVAVGD